MVRQEIPNLLMWVRFLHPVPCPGNSVEECFATNEEDGGSNPSQGVGHFPKCPLRLLLCPKVVYNSWIHKQNDVESISYRRPALWALGGMQVPHE